MRVLAALLLLLGPALAGPKYPDCVKDSKTAVEIARTRGKLIFLTVMVDNDGENRMVIDAVFRNKSFIKISKEFVCLLANPHDQHGKVAVKDPKTGKKVHRCADCPAITCLDHMTLAQNYARGFFPDNNAKTPIHFVINQDEDVIHTIKNGDFETGFNHVEGKIVVQELRKVLKKHGRGLSEIEYKGMLRNLSDAKAARFRKKTTLELQKLLKVVALRRKVVGVETARARIKEIDAIAAKELAEIEKTQLGQKKWEEGLAALDKLIATYPGTLTVGVATKRKAELVKRSDVKKLLKLAADYKKGLEYREKGRLELARKRFEKCIRLGKGTKYVDLAKKALEELGAG